jgi:chemotaxis protein CheC
MKLTDKQLDILTELINIGVGRGASVLNTMIRSHIKLDVPFLKVLEFSEFKMEMKALDSDKFAVVELAFEGAFSGISELIFPTESAAKLVKIIASEDSKGFDLDSIRAGTLAEIGNIVLNGVMGSISNMLQSHFRYSVPNFKEGTVDELFKSFDSGFESTILMARTRFTVEELKIEGDLVLFFEMNAFSTFLAAIDAFSVDSLE